MVSSVTDLALYLLACYGLTFFVVDSTFPPWEFVRAKLERVEFLKALFDCYFCSGFWCSALLFLCLPHPLGVKPLILFSFSGAAFSYVMFMFVSAIDSYISRR